MNRRREIIFRNAQHCCRTCLGLSPWSVFAQHGRVHPLGSEVYAGPSMNIMQGRRPDGRRHRSSYNTLLSCTEQLGGTVPVELLQILRLGRSWQPLRGSIVPQYLIPNTLRLRIYSFTKHRSLHILRWTRNSSVFKAHLYFVHKRLARR